MTNVIKMEGSLWLHETKLVVLFLSLLAFVEGDNEGFESPNSDCGATNYVNFKGKAFHSGWSYPVGNDFHYVASTQGTLFVQSSKVVALSTSGEKLWEVSGKGWTFNSDDLVYHEGTDTLVMGWWNTDLPDVVVAMKGKSRKTIWKNEHNDDISTEPITLLNRQNAIVVVSNDGSSGDYIAALDLVDGSLLWNVTSDLPDFYDPTRTSVLCDGKAMLFRYSTPGGSDGLNAYDSRTGQFKWRVPVPYGYKQLASSEDVIYMTYSPSCTDADVVMGVHPASGTTLWRILSPCECNGYLSGTHGTAGPAVDKRGNAYFSCGNRAYSLDARGLVRWITPVFNDNWNPCDRALAPSYHPAGFVYLTPTTPESVLYVLSGHTGKIVHTYHLSGVEYSSIILMGNEFIYLIGTNVTTIRMERPRVE